MIHDLISHARGLHLQPGEVLEVQLPRFDKPEPDCIVRLHDFLLRWDGVTGCGDCWRAEFEFGDCCFIGLVHGEGVALFAFEQSEVAQ